MKKFSHYLSVRSVRLSALAVLVATFVGLPALGQAIGSRAFEKLDAVSYLSNVLLADDKVTLSSESETSPKKYEYIGNEYEEPVGAQVKTEKSQINAQITETSDINKDWFTFTETTNRLTKKFTEIASQIDRLGLDNSKVVSMLVSVIEIDADISENVKEMNFYFDSLKNSVSNLSSTSTGADVASLKTDAQLLQTYNTLGLAMGVRIEAIQQAEYLANIYLQISTVKAEYGSDSMPDEVSEELDEVESEADRLAEYISQAKDQYINISEEITNVKAETNPLKVSENLVNTYSLGADLSAFSDKMKKDFESFWELNPLNEEKHASL